MIVVIGWITIEPAASWNPRRRYVVEGEKRLIHARREVATAHACAWLTSEDDAELNAALASAEAHLSRSVAESPEWDQIEWTGFPTNEPDPLSKLRVRLLASATESFKALATIAAGARKLETAIAKYRAGDLDHASIARAIARLDDRRRKAEIVTSRRACGESHAIVRRLREALDGAEQAHVDARQAHYAAESTRLADEARHARSHPY